MTSDTTDNNSFSLETEISSHASGSLGLSTRLFPKWMNGFGFQALMVILFAIVLYANTFNHEYALDDAVVITNNEYVHNGFAGLKDIFSKDTYDSYYRQLKSRNQVLGGRYRPLSVAMFAVEQQLFGITGPVTSDQAGADVNLRLAHIRHVLNVCWYALALVALLYFLRYVVFRRQPGLAFLATLIFLAHPLHTEVVANVKSRDEIMSLLFICLTFITAFKYNETRQKKMLLFSFFFFFLAYLSKEYAITLVVLIPLALYVFGDHTPSQALRAGIPYIAISILYVCVRLIVMPERAEMADTDIQVNPYAYASNNERRATEIATSIKYLKLLLIPHPLSSDYSYNQIPYNDFSYPLVWIAILTYIALIVSMIYYVMRKHVLGFALAFFAVNFLLINNFIFNIGATIGERLIFHASIGFSIAVAYLLVKLCERLPTLQMQRAVLLAVFAIVLALYSFKTIERNPDWKNDASLFLRDIETSPNSFLVNTNVATILINGADEERDPALRLEHLHKGIGLLKRAVTMQSNYVLGYLNLSVAYLKLREPDSVIYNLEIVRGLFPFHPQLPQMYYYAGMDYFDDKAYLKANAALRMAANLDTTFAEPRKQLAIVDSLMRVNKN